MELHALVLMLPQIVDPKVYDLLPFRWVADGPRGSCLLVSVCHGQQGQERDTAHQGVFTCLLPMLPACSYSSRRPFLSSVGRLDKDTSGERPALPKD